MADVSSAIRRYSLERMRFLLRKIFIKKETKRKNKREKEIMWEKNQFRLFQDKFSMSNVKYPVMSEFRRTQLCETLSAE